MRTNFFPLSYLVFGLVVLSLAASRGEEDDDRIVGGDEVEAHSLPWQVGLMNKGANWIFCGGTILSATKILTAAHCRKNPSNIEVIVGEHSLVSATDGVRHGVTSFENHPNYGVAWQLDSDFAIITLTEPIDLGDKAQPAFLPAAGIGLEVGQLLTVSGWGTTSSGGGSPNVLHAVQVPYITNQQCQAAYAGYPISANMMCAGNVEQGGIDSCQGDSGGPLTAHNVVVGVVSWGIGCAKPGRPGVYARVSDQLQWITSKVCGSPNTQTACNGDTTEQPTTQLPDGSSTQQPDDSSTQQPDDSSTQQPEEPEEEPVHPNPQECNMAWVADGICDARNNHAGCFFDGNDCCSGIDGSDKFCHKKVKGCKCKKNAFKKCHTVEYAHDDYCDDENNTAECNYDGGDCCTRKILNWTDYCSDCQCIFPDSTAPQ